MPEEAGDDSARLDRYAPADDGSALPRPVAVLAFGGAFHRGSGTSVPLDMTSTESPAPVLDEEFPWHEPSIPLDELRYFTSEMKILGVYPADPRRG